MMRRTAQLGLMLALALIFSYVESLIPFSFGIPGIKLGLPNAVVLLLLYGETKSQFMEPGEVPKVSPVKFFTKGAREALLVNGLRIVLSGFLFGSLYTVLYALAGAGLSFAMMLFGRRAGCFSPVGVSVLGGVFHNVGQILVAMAVVETFTVVYYLPVLILAGVVTGALLGIIVMELMPYLRRLPL